jgi:hypothetical protein
MTRAGTPPSSHGRFSGLLLRTKERAKESFANSADTRDRCCWRPHGHRDRSSLRTCWPLASYWGVHLTILSLLPVAREMQSLRSLACASVSCTTSMLDIRRRYLIAKSGQKYGGQLPGPKQRHVRARSSARLRRRRVSACRAAYAPSPAWCLPRDSSCSVRVACPLEQQTKIPRR